MKKLLLLAGMTICFMSQMLGQGLFEGFERPWINGAPENWTKTQLSGTQDWARKKMPLAGHGRPRAARAAGDSCVAWFESGPANTGSRTRLESPVMDFTGLTHPTVTFAYVNRAGTDSVYIQYSVDGGTNWTVAAGYGATADSSWKSYLVSLENIAGLANVKIGIEAIADTSLSDIWIDNFRAQAYPHVSVHDIQAVSADSLAQADILQLASGPRWTLQTTPYMGDTVTVTAICVAPAKVITYTAAGWTMLVYDTAEVPSFRGMLVRGNSPVDTAQLIADGFLNVAAGDVIEMTGVLSEFPTTNMNSLTQFQPIAGIPIAIVGSAPVPRPVVKNVSDFFTGISGAGTAKVNFSAGEPFESMYVEFHNVTVDGNVNFTRGTFSMIDADGNQISDYDYSHFYTKGHGTYPADTSWDRIYPDIVGTNIDTIRGVIGTSSGSENARGYRICPLYPGDIVLGKVYPSLSTHRRNPVLVSSDSVARISVKAAKRGLGYGISSVTLYYSLNNAAFVPVSMAYQAADTTYVASIPSQAAGTFVHYFVQVADSAANIVTLANTSNGAVGADTSKGFFFYTVINGPPTIRDVQYTPYSNGRSGYVGATVSVAGIVTADTAHMGISPSGTAGYGTNAWYLESSSLPWSGWSGIWVVGTDSTLKALVNGDSVKVTGTVLEEQTGTANNVTRINVTAPVVKYASGLPEPAPVLLTTGGFMYGVPNGSPWAEMYEGMLVRFSHLTVTNVYPTFSDPTEFNVDDGSGPICVRLDGKSTYSNVEADSVSGKQILVVGSKIDALIGVIFYSFNQYKVVPRTNADFQNVTSVEAKQGRAIPATYAVAQNYPNPFNPSTTIQYAVPTNGLVSLKVYNLLGQEVASLVNEVKAAGTYTVRFDASRLSSGVYFYRIQAGSFTQVKKMLLMK